MASKIETAIRGAVTKGVMGLASVNAAMKKAPEDGHTFLTGIHTPLEEEFSLENLEVKGEIPSHLDGRYVRIGPNPINPNPATHHWFLGDGMVHGVKLKNGKAEWYKNRWIRSNEVSAHLGEAAMPGERHPRTDTANTNVLAMGGQTMAIVEAGGFPVRLSDELETIEHGPFEGAEVGSFTAHPHECPRTGEYHAICYDAEDMERVRHVVLNAEGKVIREEPIPVQDGPSIHDCMITENYVLIFDLPVTFSMKRLMGGYGFPYAWNPDHKARIGVLKRDGKGEDVIWCDVEPCYVFHPCNGFETHDGQIIVDVCAHESMFANSTEGPDSNSTPFERWMIDLGERQVERKVIDARPQEFPRPNEAYMTKPYRYAYTVALPRDAATFMDDTGLFKHDLETGGKQTHHFGKGQMPGEFVFVEKPEAKAEDDGWLMGYVIDTENDTTKLVILDAANFEGEPQAEIIIPHRIPPGFHGNWMPSD